jgi:thiol-disulfide isomerase/thioredoxin
LTETIMNPLRRLAAPLGILAVMAMFVGTVMPADAQGVVLRGLDGEQLVEADLAQGATIFIVWASWSPHFRDIVARVNPMVQRWSGKARVVTVNFQGDRQAVKGFLAGKTFGTTVYLDTDGAFSKKYAVATLPGLLIIKDGRVVYRGKLPEDPDRVIADVLG